MNSKTLEIQEFIKSRGQANLSRELNIPISTIAKWSNLVKAPRYVTAAKLIEFSDGQLTWESIYAPFARKKAGREQ